MSANWTITAEWEPLDSGSPEEKACFGAIGIQAHGVWLTEGRDGLANRLRKAPLLSAYRLAEWIAWNWWRLRWEPRSGRTDWVFSHHLATIGGGYIWPNLTIFSDGERTALLAKPTAERPQTPFRYIADFAAFIQAAEFEAEVDNFIDQVLQRLEQEGVANTNLATIWAAILEERRSGERARERKFEALLGREPDESDPMLLAQLVADANDLSTGAVEEIAADYTPGRFLPTATELKQIAKENGFDASPRDAVRLAPGSGLPRIGEVAAWRRGEIAAKALRIQQRLNGEPLSDERLTEIAGTDTAVLRERKAGTDFSFALDSNPGHSRLVLRSRWATGRRFELARLVGDRLIAAKAGRLFPATRSYTYRQKTQRAFAAELLSPFELVEEMLRGDYSMENQLEVAHHFGVSELTIRTQLVNHGRLEREEIGGEFEVSAE
jgi:hypothetical protein